MRDGDVCHGWEWAVRAVDDWQKGKGRVIMLGGGMGTLIGERVG